MTLESALQEITRLKQQVAYLQNKLYGRSSERHSSPPSSDEQQLLFGTLDSARENEESNVEIATHTRRRGKQRTSEEQDCPEGTFPPHLHREERIIDVLPEGVTTAEECELIGEEVTERLAQQPSQPYVIRTVRKKYKMKATGVIFCPPAPEHLFGRCMVDESFLTLMVINKVLWHIPLYRQVQALKYQGVALDRGSMARWMIRLSEFFSPVVQALIRELLTQPYLHCDDTPFTVGKQQKNTGKKKYTTGYFWPLVAEHIGVAFVYTGTKSTASCREVLKDFNGTLVSDAYQVFEALAHENGYSMQLCMMHVRRYFYKALEGNKARAEEALEFIRQLYAVEARVKQYSTRDEKLLLRQTESAQIMKDFHTWMKKIAGTPEAITDDALAKALSYVMKRWESAERFLYDPDIPIDNGAAERKIRPFKLGAKNWMFAASEVGAEALAVFYSLVYSALMHGIDPYQYLLDLAYRINQPGLTAHDLTPAQWKIKFNPQDVTGAR